MKDHKIDKSKFANKYLAVESDKKAEKKESASTKKMELSFRKEQKSMDEVSLIQETT